MADPTGLESGNDDPGAPKQPGATAILDQMAEGFIAGNGQAIARETFKSVGLSEKDANGLGIPGDKTDRNNAISSMAKTGNEMGIKDIQLRDGNSYSEAEAFARKNGITDSYTVTGLAYFLDVRKTMPMPEAQNAALPKAGQDIQAVEPAPVVAAANSAPFRL